MKALLRLLHGPVYERRLEVLCDLLGDHVHSGESLLDVGCGSGELGRRLGDRYELDVKGLEVRPRDGCQIPVTSYDGAVFPMDDDSVDTVLLADILHHEHDPQQVLREAGRVASKRVIVKDHKVEGLLAQARISFIDWAANAGYDVPCLYQYHTGPGWTEFVQSCHLKEEVVHRSIDLYPPGLNLLFGKKLQYLAVLHPLS